MGKPAFTDAEIAAKWPEYSRRIQHHIAHALALEVTTEDVEAWRMALQLAEKAQAHTNG